PPVSYLIRSLHDALPISVIPLWMYITGSILLLIIIILVILLVRNRKQDEDLLVEEMETPEETFDIPDIAEAQETESEVRKKQLRSEEHTSELQSRFDLVC